MFDFLKSGPRAKGSRRVLQVSRFFGVNLDDYASVGERDAILASSGMGKSYLTGVLAEETLENGNLLCIIDPEGEHWTLAERYPILIVGGEQANVPLNEECIDLYIDMMLTANLSCIFDLSDFLDNEQQEYYALIVDKLFQAEQTHRKKVRLIVEEAQIYAPQRMAGTTKGGKTNLDPLTASQKIAKRGRKRALDSLWATQRPASISKDILSQCNRFWFGGISAEQDYKAIRPFLNEAKISFGDIKSLHPGEFFFYSRGQTKLIKVRKRHCRHGGATPDGTIPIQATGDGSLKRAIEALAEQIDKRSTEIRQEEAEMAKLKNRVRDLERINTNLLKELDQERLATKVIERLDPKTITNASAASIAERLTATLNEEPPGGEAMIRPRPRRRRTAVDLPDFPAELA